MRAWYGMFDSIPTTLRKALVRGDLHERFQDALHELQLVERDGSVNRSRLGQFLRKNANRIVDGLEFRKTEADGRTAWQVVPVGSPSPEPLPPPTRAESGDVIACRDETVPDL